MAAQGGQGRPPLRIRKPRPSIPGSIWSSSPFRILKNIGHGLDKILLFSDAVVIERALPETPIPSFSPEEPRGVRLPARDRINKVRCAHPHQQMHVVRHETIGHKIRVAVETSALHCTENRLRNDLAVQVRPLVLAANRDRKDGVRVGVSRPWKTNRFSTRRPAWTCHALIVTLSAETAHRGRPVMPRETPTVAARSMP